MNHLSPTNYKNIIKLWFSYVTVKTMPANSSGRNKQHDDHQKMWPRNTAMPTGETGSPDIQINVFLITMLNKQWQCMEGKNTHIQYTQYT